MKYYIVFMPSSIWWIRLFCKKAVGHCNIIMEGKGMLVKFNTTGIEFIKIGELEKALLDSTYIVLEVKKQIRTKSFLGFKFFSCVTLCKYFLGLDTWAFTPWQLYKFIIKKNREV